MVTRLGTCKEAFLVKERGLVLGFRLYSEHKNLHSRDVQAKIIKDGREIYQVACQFTMILSGKHDRYDMNPYNLIILDVIPKQDVIDSTIYLLDDYSFWQPH